MEVRFKKGEVPFDPSTVYVRSNKGVMLKITENRKGMNIEIDQICNVRIDGVKIEIRSYYENKN